MASFVFLKTAENANGLRLTVGALLLLVCSAPTVLPQEKPALLSRIERAFSKKPQTWKIERIDAKHPTDPAAEDIFLRSRGKDAKIAITIWKRPKDAHDVFEAFARVGTRPQGVERVSVKDLGDENYTWTSPSSSDPRSLTFRSGNVMVIVHAPSILIAEQFARKVLGEIKAEPVATSLDSEQ